MKATTRSYAFARIAVCFIIGAGCSLLVSPAGSGGNADARASRYTYCSAGDYYETWNGGASNSFGSVSASEQMHYRVNSDCTWKAYWQNYKGLGGSSCGCGAPPNYINGARLFQGVPNNYFYFDSSSFSCQSPPGNAWIGGYFGQYSASSALIQTQTTWYTNASCTAGPVTDPYNVYNQP